MFGDLLKDLEGLKSAKVAVSRRTIGFKEPLMPDDHTVYQRFLTTATSDASRVMIGPLEVAMCFPVGAIEVYGAELRRVQVLLDLWLLFGLRVSIEHISRHARSPVRLK